MNIEDVKKELNSYKYDLKLIESIEEQIDKYATKRDSCTAELSNMPKGNPVVQDRMAEYIAKIEDLRADKYKRLNELEKKTKSIENVIFKLEQPYKTILYNTYIKGDTLTETACEIRKDYKYTCRLHGKALIKYLKEREKDVSSETSKKRQKSWMGTR